MTKKKEMKRTTKKTAKEGKCACGHDNCGCMLFSIVLSEGAFYAALYYGLYLLGVSTAGMWWKVLILFGLINLAIVFCPVMNPHLRHKFGHGYHCCE